jgi:hypothetical protein
MASLNKYEGTVIARCPGCDGAKSTFEWSHKGKELGAITKQVDDRYWRQCLLDFRLFRCAGCGIGALGVIKYGGGNGYPGLSNRLLRFVPEAKSCLPLPPRAPKELVAEFREAERCLEINCLRAAAGLFRSVLAKTMRANGYETSREKHLLKQIDGAAKDGVITLARKKRLHAELRVIDTDVLPDAPCNPTIQDIELARRYCQRILEDFYDDRESVLKLLRDAGRMINEDKNTQVKEDAHQPVSSPRAQLAANARR